MAEKKPRFEPGHQLRARLDGKSPLPEEEIEQRLARLKQLCEERDAAERRAAGFAGALYADGIVPTTWYGAGGFGYCGWHPDLKMWVDSHEEPGLPEPRQREPGLGGRVIEEYTTRPTKKEALEHWNWCLRISGRPPLRFCRVYGRGYCAEYRDDRGRVVRVWDR